MAAPTDKTLVEQTVPKIREMKCIMHLDSVKEGDPKMLTKVRWTKFAICAKEWINLDGNDRVIAENVRSIIEKIQTDVTGFKEKETGLGFHPTCYRRFIDKTRLYKAKKRCASTSRRSSSSSNSSYTMPPTPKKLRSSIPSMNNLATPPIHGRFDKLKSASVLPPVCIICRKPDKYIFKLGKQERDRLMQAETSDAGLLRQSAILKRDEAVLLHIRDKDCVAIEVRYHRSCYLSYTRISRVPDATMYEYPSDDTNQAYKEFCETIINTRIIENYEILRMSKLVSLYTEICQQHGQTNITIRNDRLKYKLQKDFPELCFHSPFHKNVSEMVFVQSLPAESLLSTIPTSSETDIESTDMESDSPFGIKMGHSSEYNDVRTLYTASLIIHKALKETPGLLSPWPPTSADLTIDNAKLTIPIQLYNFLAWSIGASEDLKLNQFVDLPDIVNSKLLSLCQDIVYLASKGHKETAKSLCLGLTTRHLTGSSQMLTILNRLGHCPSVDKIREYETSLAQLQLMMKSEIPKGFSKNVHTIAVWDNIDFGEETLSGKGTTHHTNGILIQSQMSVTNENRPTGVIVKKGVRSLPFQSEILTPFYVSKRQGPQNLGGEIDLELKNYLVHLKPCLRLDFAYIISKYIESDIIVLPGWTGFNTQLQKPQLPKSAIHYLPVIEASPTEMTTVNTILTKSLELADRLEVPYIVLVFDQAIYAKAQEIRWKNENLSKKIVIRLGEFHTCMSFVGVLGHFFKDAGLKDILIESEVVAEGSINGVINGHHYNRSIRAHKSLFEALHRLRFRSYLESLTETEETQVCQLIHGLKYSYPTPEFSKLIESEYFNDLVSNYNVYVEKKNTENATFCFWSMYIDLVQYLMTFIRATRESNWNIHLSVLRSMMPWFFAADRQNYSRYLPAYWLEMMKLSDSHPECFQELSVKGQWTVQRQQKHSFASIACDQAIEQTCNRDSKTKGGLTGMTLNSSATQRWILAQPQRAAITRQCESMAGLNPYERKRRKDLDRTRMTKDENAVQSIMSTIDSMINPFESPEDELICLSSGVVLSEDIKSGLLNARQKGNTAFVDFVNTRLINKEEDIFTPIKSLKIKTFSNQTKKSKSGKDTAIQNDRKFFARLLIISQSRQLDMKDVLSYSLGSISFPLASVDGSLAKTDKSAMLTILENQADGCYIDVLPTTDNIALLVDAMALIQSMNNIPSTFGELADSIFIQLVNLSKKYNSSRIDFITDRYPSVSIKNIERSRRAAAGKQILHIYSKEQKTPKQWKKFLSSGENKESLIEFLFFAWKSVDISTVQQKFELFITHGEECHLLKAENNTSSMTAVDSLRCDHEEADTRLLLHAKHASNLGFSIAIRSPDTDVAVIALGLMKSLDQKVYFITGTKTRNRIIDLQQITSAIGIEVCNCLIGLHCFTGCDTTSAFYGKGKKKAYQIAVSDKKYIAMFSDLGSLYTFKEDLLPIFESFVCQLYGLQSDDVNEARYKIFCLGSCSEQSLPPTKDALTQHLKRVNYQAAIHHRAMEQWMRAPSPVGYGWQKNMEDLVVDWMRRLPAPNSILETLQCGCKTGCESARCSCLKSKLSCTDFCKCLNCNNKQMTTMEQDTENIHTSDDDDDDESDIDF